MFELKVSLHQAENTFIIGQVINRLSRWLKSFLGVSSNDKCSSARVHIYYCVTDKYVLKVAYVFQPIISAHQLQSIFIIS